MNKYIALMLVPVAVGVAACGGSSSGGSTTTSDVQQIKQVTTQQVSALASDKPADACQLVTKASKTACMKQILMLKALGGKRIVLAALPHDWKHQIEVAKVIVNGNTATMPGLAGGKGRLTQYQRVDGHWLVVIASS